MNPQPCLAEVNSGMAKKYADDKRVHVAPPLVVPHKAEGL